MSEENGSANALVSKDKTGDTMKSLLDNFEGDDDRKSWASFQERIAKAPQQVLRYCRNGSTKPLWPMSSGRPSKPDIPTCTYCQGPLCFEFQILPQLLFYFNVKNDVDSLDWATVAVYTCEASCEGTLAYKQEYAWVQLSSQSVTVS
ncbi:Programmed cell death protein 2 [Morella rubra]|uniref:Programmed cell death protein 2 n=1 Tax=Morella rubra TaxID=262757 RepID=A0A6A1WIW5_9ROSI|nr:Programmed cell death protein 2 [Morella rubra]